MDALKNVEIVKFESNSSTCVFASRNNCGFVKKATYYHPTVVWMSRYLMVG